MKKMTTIKKELQNQIKLWNEQLLLGKGAKAHDVHIRQHLVLLVSHLQMNVT